MRCHFNSVHAHRSWNALPDRNRVSVSHTHCKQSSVCVCVCVRAASVHEYTSLGERASAKWFKHWQ